LLAWVFLLPLNLDLNEMFIGWTGVPGGPLSVAGFVNAACASEIRSRRLLRAIRQWEAEHGKITDEELQRVWTELLA
jgi:hypothetical protein